MGLKERLQSLPVACVMGASVATYPEAIERIHQTMDPLIAPTAVTNLFALAGAIPLISGLVTAFTYGNSLGSKLERAGHDLADSAMVHGFIKGFALMLPVGLMAPPASAGITLMETLQNPVAWGVGLGTALVTYLFNLKEENIIKKLSNLNPVTRFMNLLESKVEIDDPKEQLILNTISEHLGNFKKSFKI